MALECLKAEATSPRISSRRPRFKVARRTVEQAAANIPARISFWHDHDEIRTAAINQTATVAERLVRVSGDVVDDLTTKMTDPAPDEVGDLCDLLYRLLIPSEFRGVLDSGPLVFEVDRAMAQLNWEMLATGNGAGVMPLWVHGRSPDSCAPRTARTRRGPGARARSSACSSWATPEIRRMATTCPAHVARR